MAIDGHWLPVAFGILLALSVFLYMILDGYDIGVGLLLPFSKSLQMKSEMIATMGPFWDANETVGPPRDERLRSITRAAGEEKKMTTIEA